MTSRESDRVSDGRSGIGFDFFWLGQLLSVDPAVTGEALTPLYVKTLLQAAWMIS